MLNLGLTELYQILTPDWSAKSINISETKNLISSYLTLNVTSQVRKQFYSEDLEQTSRWMLIKVSSILAFKTNKILCLFLIWWWKYACQQIDPMRRTQKPFLSLERLLESLITHPKKEHILVTKTYIPYFQNVYLLPNCNPIYVSDH